MVRARESTPAGLARTHFLNFGLETRQI